MGIRRPIRTMVLWGAASAALACASPAWAATPPSGTLTPDADGGGSLTWSGAAHVGTEALRDDQGNGCFGTDSRPNPASGCDFFSLDVAADAAFYTEHPGAVSVTASGFPLGDLDLYVYRRNPDGTRGDYVTGDGESLGVDEAAGIDKASGSYYVVLTPYTTLGTQSYHATAQLATRQGPSLAAISKAAPPGVRNYRASHDKFTSHSEPTIAMDPLDHNHLMAGSKMFENNDNYLFKIGTYESFDGGRSWTDEGQLPGYCQAPGQCDPNNVAAYRTTSDVSIAFDDEGDAYANVLDAPGGTAAFHGFNMTVHIKRPGQPWTGPITVHDNRLNALTDQLLLDDKNWLAVDNHTDINGGPNRPNDGKIGTMYVCWSLDGVTLPLQEIVLMRSLDGGHTWGGIRPKDNIPLPLSQKTLVSGIGCHVAIGPHGEVYATWYDNQLNAIMQAKSTNRGQTFTPAVPIAGIQGVNNPFTGESFRNLSIPTTGVDGKGNVYVAVTSQDGEGRPVLGDLFALGKKIKEGDIGLDTLNDLVSPGDEDDAGVETEAGGDGNGPESGSDVVLFKSTNGGRSYTGPVRVNQDPGNSDADQFQPWIAVTDSGKVQISYFDRRDDPGNYFIDTYLSTSTDGGRTFTDQRVSERMWNPAIAAPTSVSGSFIGDYQGLAADDNVAIPFWNDTQLATNLAPTDKDYSPYQEVFAARVPPDPPGAPLPHCFGDRITIGRRAVGRLSLGSTRSTVKRRAGVAIVRVNDTYRYCVKGGGSVVAAFDARGRVALVATTGPHHRLAEIGRGSSTATLRRRFRGRLHSVRPGVLRVDRPGAQTVFFGVKPGKVTFVALADRAASSGPLLGRLLRRARLTR